MFVQDQKVRICQHCGKPFIGKVTALFDSVRCRVAHFRQRLKDKESARKREHHRKRTRRARKGGV